MRGFGLRNLISFVAVTCGTALATAQTATDIDFVSQIRPILSDKCFNCHGPDASHRQADLRFDLESSATADLGGYQAIVPGDAEQSEMVVRLTAADADDRMPPVDSGKSLTAAEIELVIKWIEQGAKWQQHWAYVPPRRHPLPDVENDQWIDNWIDRFILTRAQSAKVPPTGDADRRTLIRRLYFDLIGLPPSPAEVQSFVGAPAPDAQAVEAVVDRLLESEHFGERLAIYWLDLVRYADTVGYHGDQDHNISPYRDWVIDALNDNMPFDQFTREQIAGDLLPNSTTDQKIAASYNRLLQTSHEGGVQPGEYMAIYAADRVRNLSAVWMGATVGCAQCHDHKYDPYTSRDFYSLAAFFADIDDAEHLTKGVDAVPTARHPEIKVFTRRERTAIARIEREISLLEERKQDGNDTDDSARRQLESLTAELERIKSNQRSIMLTRALAEPRETRILPRGNWLDKSGEVVMPAVPEFLGSIADSGRRATRLDLADWLTDAESGVGLLTARVFVNRLWYLFFGAGISRDVGDFGGQGTPPAHPELLDRLAIEFVDSGWDVKHMVRLLLNSHTYRLSSIPTKRQLEGDPENSLFVRQGRWRLPAELIRDNALAVSGLLVTDIGGASVKPYQPAGYYRHLNFPQRQYQPDLIPQKQWRRGLYVHWQRQFLQPMLKGFDAPMREECTAQRPISNTPTAALALLNDPTFVEAARALARRTISEGGDSVDQKITFAFHWATSRPPQPNELDVLRDVFQRQRARFENDRQAAQKLLEVGLLDQPTNDLPQHAAWTSVARVMLNLNETITRN